MAVCALMRCIRLSSELMALQKEFSKSAYTSSTAEYSMFSVRNISDLLILVVVSILVL